MNRDKASLLDIAKAAQQVLQFSEGLGKDALAILDLDSQPSAKMPPGDRLSACRKSSCLL